VTSKDNPRVVIVGGGFAGLYAARKLGNKPVRVMLLDRKNHHLFQPLLYQVATAGLSPADIAAPIRWILRKKRNVEVLLCETTGIDLERKVVLSCDVEIPYDYLILATGAGHAYFGHEEWQKYAPGLKSLEDATDIRRRVLLAFEKAERKALVEGAHPTVNFVVVGGGPTGVELAGTLAEVARVAMKNDFRAIDPSQTRILLLEGSPRVLAAYPEDLSQSAREQLTELGVEVHTSTVVTYVGPDEVRVGDRSIPSAVTLWAAGVAASPLGRKLGVPVDKAGRVIVNEDLTIPGHPEVFVCGDLASAKQSDGTLVPGVAPAAIQMGEYAARTILGEFKGEKRSPFSYWNKGSLATIGRAAAVADFGKLHFSGFPAWLGWLFIHLFFLIGFRNRLLVIIDWAWSYLTFQRSARLITNLHSYAPTDSPRADVPQEHVEAQKAS
jgi:NADH:ubiquinone reductase (H+-translocating)